MNDDSHRRPHGGGPTWPTENDHAWPTGNEPAWPTGNEPAWPTGGDPDASGKPQGAGESTGMWRPQWDADEPSGRGWGGAPGGNRPPGPPSRHRFENSPLAASGQGPGGPQRPPARPGDRPAGRPMPQPRDHETELLPLAMDDPYQREPELFTHRD
ncbi:MAG: hypothetical protein ACRDRN_26380, partial [Sciscionella sp.]